MNKYIVKEKIKLMVPYFVLAVAIIIAFRIIMEVQFVFDAATNVWNIIRPFFYGFLLAYIINMPLSSIQLLLMKTGNRFIIRRKKLLSLLIVLIIFAGVITLTLNLIIPAIADSITFFIANAEGYWLTVVGFIDDFNEIAPFGWVISEEGIFNLLGEIFSDFSLEYLMTPINAIVGAGAAVFTGFLAFISSIYILVEKEKGKALAHRMIKLVASETVYSTTIEGFHRLNQNFRQYIRTQTIDGLILGTMATILLLILGSPFALVLGIMLGIVNYIPYFGSIFGTVVAVIIVAITGGFTDAAIAAVSLLVIQQIDANIIQPRLMSGSFSLSPLLVIISISFGGAVAGIIGMIVAIPIVAVLKDLFDYIVSHYEEKKKRKAREGKGYNG